MARSIEQGEIVPVEPGPTIADGLKPTRVGKLNFEIAKEHLAGCYTVEDREIGRALVRLLLLGKTLVEPSGAAALAVALGGKLPGSPRRVGVILSGGNIAPERLAQLLAEHAGL
jgi:threonine dehydratase